LIDITQKTLSETGTLTQDVLTNPIVKTLLIPIILLILGWILKGIYDKYFSIKPRLFLRLGKPLYGQVIKGYDIGHDLTWRYECELKNNSKFDAYNIELFEVVSNDEIISNKVELRYYFRENNHLGSNETQKFEIKKIISVDPEVLIKSTIEQGEKIIIPGSKVSNPELSLRPKCLNNIRLVIKYESEKGKTFYIKFTRFSDKENSKIKSIRPFWLKEIRN